jgi:hypothetical protein
MDKIVAMSQETKRAAVAAVERRGRKPDWIPQHSPATRFSTTMLFNSPS